VASIATMHRHAGIENPCAAEEVRLALKRMHHARTTHQRQAPALTRPLVDRMLSATGDRLIDARDRAILAVAYDTLCRRSELVRLDVADVLMADDGTATCSSDARKPTRLVPAWCAFSPSIRCATSSPGSPRPATPPAGCSDR